MINEPNKGLKKDLVVYYWTNLSLLDQGKGLNQQTQDFTKWLDQQKRQGLVDLTVIAEFTEKHLKRTKPKYFPELKNSIDLCIQKNARLVIVKLNGLISRDAFANLLATSGLDFVCIDKSLVTPEALAVVRQYVTEQSKQHGDSIKRGLMLTTNKLGNPNAAKAITPFNKIKTENSVLFALLLQPIIIKYQQQNLSQRAMVDKLNDSGVLAPEGGKWVLSQLQKVLKRITTNNLAIQIANEVIINNYQDYSASDLMNKLNQSKIKPFVQGEWSEEVIIAAKNRNQTIQHVLELYDFMQQHSPAIDKWIAEGKTLDLVAKELNTRNIKVPKGLLTESHGSSSIWDISLVEQIIKRMNNELKLPYNDIILKDFCAALDEYVQNSTNSKEKAIYAHDALRNLVEQNIGRKDSNNYSI